MNKEDRIKGHFSAIAECAGNLRRNYDPERAIENDEVVQYLQKQLDAIKKLPEPEPEMLSSDQAQAVYGHLHVIEETAGGTGFLYRWGIGSLVSKLQKELDAIKELLKPEQETLAGTVLRLTGTCNGLGRENALLHNDLTDMTLNFNTAEQHAKELRADLGVVTRSNAWLRKRIEVLEKENTTLRTVRTANHRLLRRRGNTIEALKKRNDKLEQDLAVVESLQAPCSKVMTDAEVTKLRASHVRLLRRNKRLEEDLNEADAHTVELRKDLAHIRTENRGLKHKLEQAPWDATKLKRELALKTRKLQRMAQVLKAEQHLK